MIGRAELEEALERNRALFEALPDDGHGENVERQLTALNIDVAAFGAEVRTVISNLAQSGEVPEELGVEYVTGYVNGFIDGVSAARAERAAAESG